MNMDINTYVRKLKTYLGGSVVDIEIPDSEIENIINDSLDDLSPYIASTSYMTLPYQKVIDLSDKDVYNVYQVFRGEPNINSQVNAIQDQFGFGLGGLANSVLFTGEQTDIYGHQYDMMDQLITQMSIDQVANSMKGIHDIDFTFKDGKLYIDSTLSMSKVTIEYTKQYSDVTEVDDKFWQDKLINLSKANIKIVLGRIRSKYQIQGQSYTLDGPALLQEGNQERKDILDSLTNSASSVLQILD